MSSLWTPSGEHRVDKEADEPKAAAGRPIEPGPPPEEPPDPQAQMEALRERLASTPAETVVANHCYGLFELAAIYLASSPPMLAESRLAIDAFGFLVEGLGERLGEAAGPLREALAQIRLGFVQVETAHRAAGEAAGSADGDSGA